MSEAGKSELPQAPKETSPVSPAPAPVQASLEDVQRLGLRIGVIISAEEHPNADRLLVVKVDLGEGAPRQLVAGIRAAYQAATLVGKQVVVVANLKPATIRGIESQGMILVTQDASGLSLLSPDRPVQAGSPVK